MLDGGAPHPRCPPPGAGRAAVEEGADTQGAGAAARLARAAVRPGGGRDGLAQGKHTVSLDGLVASWPVLLVGSAKEQQRIAQGIIHRGGKLELGLQRLAHAESQLPESGRAVDGS